MAVTPGCKEGSMRMNRYAIYFAPDLPGLGRAAAAWLGRDAETGRAVAQPPVAGIAAATEAPRRYGFHATVKAPFRLAPGYQPDDLAETLSRAARDLPPLLLDGLAVETLGGRFVALRPQGDEAALGALCAGIVSGFDRFRAPALPQDIARRRPAGLTDRQRALLDLWGYPYVMDEFRFHMTLTGDLPGDEVARLRAAAADWFAPHLPRPFAVNRLCLFGEDAGGLFHQLSSCPLSG